MKGLSVSIMALVAAGLLLAGCSQAALAPTPTAVPAAPKAGEPTKAAAPAAPTSAPAAAQPTAAPAKTISFPEKGKTISILVGFAAGGSTDAGARLLAPVMEKELGTPVQVVNKPGAGGQLAFTQLAESKPYGYTLGVTQFPTIQSQYLDPERKAVFGKDSFQPVAMEVVDPGVFAVKADSKFKTLKDLIDAAKANPDQIKLGTAGLGSNTHFAGLLLQREAGIHVLFVHFDGVAPEMAALLGGHVDVYTGSVGDTYSQLKSGQIRVLAVQDRQRNKTFMPDVPTTDEQGVKVYMSSSRAISGPAKMPAQIVDVLTNSIKKAMQDPDFQKKMAQQGLTLQYMDPEQVSQSWGEFDVTVKPLMSLINAK